MYSQMNESFKCEGKKICLNWFKRNLSNKQILYDCSGKDYDPFQQIDNFYDFYKSTNTEQSNNQNKQNTEQSNNQNKQNTEQSNNQNKQNTEQSNNQNKQMTLKYSILNKIFKNSEEIKIINDLLNNNNNNNNNNQESQTKNKDNKDNVCMTPSAYWIAIMDDLIYRVKKIENLDLDNLIMSNTKFKNIIDSDTEFTNFKSLNTNFIESFYSENQFNLTLENKKFKNILLFLNLF